MLKKILMICFAFLCIPLGTMAISLPELQSDSNRYKQIGENISETAFIDTYSIEQVQYEAPYHVLKATLYLVNYEKSYILENTLTCTYDYTRSFDALWETEAKNNKENPEQIRIAVINEVKKDAGITGRITKLNSYAFSGKLLDSYLREANSPFVSDTPYKSVGYCIADFMFMKYYAKPFWKGNNPKTPNDYMTVF